MDTITRGPQPINERTVTRGKVALVDQSVSPDKLRELAAKLEQEAEFQRTVMNLGIGALTGGVGGLATVEAIGAKIAAKAVAIAGADIGLVGGAISAVASATLDPASILGFGSIEEVKSGPCWINVIGVR